MRPRVFKTIEGLRAFLASREGVALHVSVEHDAETRCTPSRCVCRPQYRVEKMTADTWLRAERAEREWLAEGVN